MSALRFAEEDVAALSDEEVLEARNLFWGEHGRRMRAKYSEEELQARCKAFVDQVVGTKEEWLAEIEERRRQRENVEVPLSAEQLAHIEQVTDEYVQDREGSPSSNIERMSSSWKGTSSRQKLTAVRSAAERIAALWPSGSPSRAASQYSASWDQDAANAPSKISYIRTFVKRFLRNGSAESNGKEE